MIAGGCVCVPSDEERLNNIAEVINDMNITWTLLTPSFIQLIHPSSVPTLRTLVLGGESMSQSHITTWADRLELINAYGPSECAVVATVRSHISMTTDPDNIGHAVGGRSWYVYSYFLAFALDPPESQSYISSLPPLEISMGIRTSNIYVE